MDAPLTGLIQCCRCHRMGGWSSGKPTVWYGVPCWVCAECAAELGLKDDDEDEL